MDELCCMFPAHLTCNLHLQLLYSLTVTLEDEYWYVRVNACAVLSQMGEKTATNEVIMKLLQRFEDNDWGVIHAARDMLKNTLSL